jgi:ornithine cyclodeaminase/alanine dehydrogenase-like protein (mu-crystallin family)
VTLLLIHADVVSSLTLAEAIEAMETTFREQGDGCVVQPQRLNARAGALAQAPSP